MRVPDKVPMYIGKNNIAKAYSNNKHFSKWVTKNTPYVYDFCNIPFCGKIISGNLSTQMFGATVLLELPRTTLNDVIENIGIKPGGLVDCNFIFIRIAGYFDIVREDSEIHKRCSLQKVKVFEEGKVYCNEKGQYLYFGKYFTRDINEKIIEVNVFKEISNKAPPFVMFKKPSLYETGESRIIYKEELSAHILNCQNEFYSKKTFAYDMTKENIYEKIFGKTLQFAMLWDTNEGSFLKNLKDVIIYTNTPTYNIPMVTTNLRTKFNFTDYYMKMIMDNFQLNMPMGLYNNTGYFKGI